MLPADGLRFAHGSEPDGSHHGALIGEISLGHFRPVPVEDLNLALTVGEVAGVESMHHFASGRTVDPIPFLEESVGVEGLALLGNLASAQAKEGANGENHREEPGRRRLSEFWL